MTGTVQQLTQVSHSMWLTSRSAFELGTQDCAMKRYLTYHAGPYGYGYQRKAVSIPLATGTYVDKGISEILKWILDTRYSTGVQPEFAPDEVIRWAADLAVSQYRTVVEKRGVLTYAQDDPASLARLQLLIEEQSYLIEGLVWCWTLARLPGILATYEILDVQPEEMYVLNCDCGLGSGLGELADHESRGCGGIGLQSRPDFLGERFTDRAKGYFELKTTSYARKSWNEGFERKQQLIIGILGAERRYGCEISHVNIEGLVKGKRQKPYGKADDPDEPKRQQTFLCYGYLREARPPISALDWMPSYEWFDADGIFRRTPKGKDGYHSVPLWEGDDDRFPGLTEGTSRTEWWVKYWMVNSPMTIGRALTLIGPIPKQRHLIDQVSRSFVCEETLWQDRLWKIYDFTEKSGKGWATPEFQELLDQTVPRSYNCDPYGPDHPCSMIPICFRDEGWQDPVGSGLYVYRAPHHSYEKEQMKARGLEPEEGLGLDPEEMEGDD